MSIEYYNQVIDSYILSYSQWIINPETDLNALSVSGLQKFCFQISKVNLLHVN